MTQTAGTDKTLGEHADDAVRKAGPFIQRVARFGLAMKGVVYIVVGILALQGALHHSSEVRADKSGAFAAILMQPFGRALLFLVALGLFAYALWRMLSASFDLERDGRDWKALGQRAGRFIGGLVYAGLGAAAIRSVLGYVARDSSQRVQDWTAWTMSHPMGRWAIALAGVITGARGVQQMVRACRFEPMENLSASGMGTVTRRCAVTVGRLGTAARGVVFLLVAAFLVVAALKADPREAKGLGAALAAVERAPYGPWALGAVAVGLIAYGVFALIQARYRLIRTQPPRT